MHQYNFPDDSRIEFSSVIIIQSIIKRRDQVYLQRLSYDKIDIMFNIVFLIQCDLTVICGL